jgi:hypothetical protein
MIRILVLLAWAAIPLVTYGQTTTPPLGPAGTIWGGEHVALEVTFEGSNLEFDCATGAITKPVQLDSPGKFKVAGTFTREHPGPVMRDGNAPTVAIYSGDLQGNTLKLNITAGPQNESAGDYVLRRGNSGRVMKCR